MNRRTVFSIVLFVSTFSLFSKEKPTYISSTITSSCKEAGHSHCSQKATQSKEFIFAFKKAYKKNKNLDSKNRFEKSWDFAKKTVKE